MSLRLLLNLGSALTAAGSVMAMLLPYSCRFRLRPEMSVGPLRVSLLGRFVVIAFGDKPLLFALRSKFLVEAIDAYGAAYARQLNNPNSEPALDVTAVPYRSPTDSTQADRKRSVSKENR